MLIVLDGAKALRKAVRMVLGEQGLVQRCRIHKQRNVLDQLLRTRKPRPAAASFRLVKKDPKVAEKELRQTAKWLKPPGPWRRPVCWRLGGNLDGSNLNLRLRSVGSCPTPTSWRTASPSRP